MKFSSEKVAGYACLAAGLYGFGWCIYAMLVIEKVIK